MYARLLVPAVALAALLSGCSMMYQVRPGQSKPATAMIPPEQRSMVWQRAVTVLLDQAYVPQLLNESACFISARRRTDIVNDALAGTTAIVAISPEGGLRVEVGGSGMFSSEQEFLSAVSTLQNDLLNLIARPPAFPAPPMR